MQYDAQPSFPTAYMDLVASWTPALARTNQRLGLSASIPWRKTMVYVVVVVTVTQAIVVVIEITVVVWSDTCGSGKMGK